MSKPKTLVTRFKIRDTILVVIFSLFLFSPLIFLGVQKVAHVEFPSWLTSESMKYLEGKNSDVGLKSSISIKGFMNGKLQSGIESKIGNYIPAKSTALLQNASLQRMFIKASNDVFGWDWYPTYYDSDCVSHKDNDLLVTPIAKKTEKAAKGLERTASYYSEIATKHPDIKFYICMPSSGLHSMLLNDLRSDPIDPDFVKEHFFDKLTNKISVVDISINDVDDYKKQYFKTDHHWQIEGAYRAYSLIAQEMGISDALKIHGGAFL